MKTTYTNISPNFDQREGKVVTLPAVVVLAEGELAVMKAVLEHLGVAVEEVVGVSMAQAELVESVAVEGVAEKADLGAQVAPASL